MIKKLTLTSVATLALIMMPAQAEGMKCQAGKCGASMKQAKQGNMMHKKKKNSPFLIKHGLPHMTKMIMKSWDDPKLALTEDQKTKLLVVRKETMSGVMRLKPEVMALQKEIVQASKAGTKAAELKAKVEKLASLETEATMVHLTCLDDSKAILSAEQYSYLMEKRKQNMMMKKENKKAMKCATGKCSGKK
jgi:Spy/CpxP family protein refolding chaperone